MYAVFNFFVVMVVIISLGIVTAFLVELNDIKAEEKRKENENGKTN